jgi:hypothetical protein
MYIMRTYLHSYTFIVFWLLVPPAPWLWKGGPKMIHRKGVLIPVPVQKYSTPGKGQLRGFAPYRHRYGNIRALVHIIPLSFMRPCTIIFIYIELYCINIILCFS